MTLIEFCLLTLTYLICTSFVAFLTYKEFRHYRFNFNILFSVFYLLTFYFGFPFTCLLVFQFGVTTAGSENLFYAMICATAFYGIYYLCYKTRIFPPRSTSAQSVVGMTRLEAGLIWFFLVAVSVGAVAIFFVQNGFLLLKLSGYSQIFSSSVSGVALKRFFYFFIPAMLIFYFVSPGKRNWIIFLITTVAFGILTYVIVGGTRANIMLAFALFLFIGIVKGYITLWMLISAGMFSVVGMFWLALRRYNLDVEDAEALYTFLYLTRDTFSPWENLALLLKNYDKIEFQGLAPMVRDFYVFVPSWLWPDRPDLILNTANYFTWNVLNYHAGLAISPTLLGSLLVMGGLAFLPVGAIIVGSIIKAFDSLYEKGKNDPNRYRGAVMQSFCFAAIFNLIVLVREGLDSFGSRIVFFIIVFGLCILLAKLVYWLFHLANVIRYQIIFRRLN